MRRMLPLVALLAVGSAVAGSVSVAADGANADPGSVRLVPVNPIGVLKPSNTCASPACTALRDLIDGATTSIDFAIYGIREQTAILDALLAAKKRGVRIRGIVDKDADDATYYSDTDFLVQSLGTVRTDHLHDAAERREQERDEPLEDRCERPKGFVGPLQCLGYDLNDRCLLAAHASREPITFAGDIMHDKFFVVDDRYVWTGSANISDSDITGYSANLVVVVDSPTVAGWYRAEIDQMYDKGLFHEKKVDPGELSAAVGDGRVQVWFPPTGRAMEAVAQRIRQARDRIDVSVFYLTHKGLTGDLIAAHLRGVRVRVIVDATSAKNDYSKHELLRAAGIPVKVEDWGGKMHAKAAVIDGRYVVAGSMNWTSAGHQKNDENVLIIESPSQAKVFEAFYDQLWASIPDRWLEGRPDPEGPTSGRSCQDNSDNDFDRLVDAKDPGCGPNPPPLPELPPWRIVPKTDGYGLVKGDIGSGGEKRYHLPGSVYYDEVKIDESQGERWFCSEQLARSAGWRKATR